MAEENISVAYRNFCFGSLNGVFHTIDTTNTSSRLLSKSSDGDLIGTAYLLNSAFVQGTNIDTLMYTGPTYLDAAQIKDGLPFFTLCSGIIKEWRLNTTEGSLDVYSTSSDMSANNYTKMAIEHYSNTFAYDTTSGTGYISVTTSGLVSTGDVLLLGPSNDNDSLNNYEYVEVTAVSGTDIYIQTLTSGVAPTNEYLSGDAITCAKYFYLFSNDGYLDKLNIKDYTLIERTYSGLYASVTVAAWYSAYKVVAFNRSEGSNLLYVDPYDEYHVFKSHNMMTTKSDKVSKWEVYALAFDGLAIYRLQAGKTLVDDTGSFTDYSWSTYNYHQDTSAVYTKSITTQTDPTAVLMNESPDTYLDTVTLRAVVRDQYGVGLLGKLVYFTKVSGDTGGYFTPLNGQAYTNASGIAEVIYNTGYYAPTGTDADSEEIKISLKTDGASTLTGSQYVWDNILLKLYKRLDGVLYLDQVASGIENIVYLDQISNSKASILYIDTLSKFSFPGGHWTGESAPASTVTKVKQLTSLNKEFYMDQIPATVSIENTAIEQLQNAIDTMTFSQTYVSRHVTSGHIATTSIDQFQFVEDAIPAFWSEKNNIGTNIWIRLRPYAFSLNQSSLVFKVKEISYAGNTGWVDVSSQCVVTTFDAGGGLLGLDILYNPITDFHYTSVVYVSIAVQDNAPIPNIILTDYWFKVIPDFKAPYITNESPVREVEEVAIDADISFDIIDVGTGVDINTLEVYVNNRRRYDITTSGISNGYHVEYSNSSNFYYGQAVEIAVKVQDTSPAANVLYDTWRFYIAGSTGPWIDQESFYPRNCAHGIPRKWAGISVNIYGIDDTGVDANSIIVHIGGKERSVTITPIILRLN